MKPPAMLIVADRGCLRAYTIARSAREPVPRLLDAVDFPEAHQRLAEQVTDRAGSFPVAGGGHASGTAGRMTLAAELDIRTFRQVAGRIMALLKQYRPDAWSFAAPAEINGAILDGVPSGYREQLVQNLARDLTHTPPGELLGHFERARP